MAAARWVIAASEMPRWLLECIESRIPQVRQIEPSACERRSPPQKWWSDSTTWTASWAIAGGRWSKLTTAMLVASGMFTSRATSAMPSMPGVGSSRYSTMPSSCSPTLIEVGTVQAVFGSSRSGWSGNASRSALIAATSSSGWKTPPLSLIAVKP